MLLFCSEPAGSCCKEVVILPNTNIWAKLITWSQRWNVTWALLITRHWFGLLCSISFEPFYGFLQCSRYFCLDDVSCLTGPHLRILGFALFFRCMNLWTWFYVCILIAMTAQTLAGFVFWKNAASQFLYEMLCTLDVKTKLDNVWLAAKWSLVCHGEPQGTVSVPLN